MPLSSCGGVALLLIGLLTAYLALRRPIVCVVVFGVATAFVISHYDSVHLQWLTWAKLGALLTAVAVIMSLYRRNTTGRRWALTGILVLNMIEAVAADLQSHRWANTAVGIVLTVCIPGAAFIETVATPRKHVLYALPVAWVAQYTVWNIGVVLAHYPQHWFDHCAVLLAPIIIAVAARDFRVWLEARAFTLTTYVVAIVGVIDVAHARWIPPLPLPPGLNFVFLGIAVLLSPWTIAAAVKQRRRRATEARSMAQVCEAAATRV